MRAVIYARYSSESQREASLEDQIRLCKERIQRKGWERVQVFRDAALSGASTLRPGYQALMEGAREAAFIVVAEALDRLSRDQEDVAALFKRLRFAGIRIITLAEGEITELHVGLNGTMSALFLRDLADKTRRGLRGRVEAGQSAGGRAFGYVVVRELENARGEPVRGKRAIHPGEAAVVREIFTRFAAGESTLAIVKALNAQRVPGPDGRAWRDTTIRGHGLRGTGILRSELYIGQLVSNRMCYVKDPATGRRVSRMNPREQWIVEDVPDPRIVDQDLWNQVQARLHGIRERSGVGRPDRPRFWKKRRAPGLLTGKVVCACCGSTVAAVGKDYLTCGKARRQGLCDNRESIRRGDLEAMVLDALRSRLMDPELVAEFTRAFTAEWNRLLAEQSSSRAMDERELAAVSRKLDNLIAAVADGFRAPRLHAQLDEQGARRSMLEAKLAAQPASEPPRLHPNLAEVYRARVANLAAALRAPHGDRAALEAGARRADRGEACRRGPGRQEPIPLTPPR